MATGRLVFGVREPAAKTIITGQGEKVGQLGEAGSRDCRVHDQHVPFCVAQEIPSNDSGRRPNIVTGYTAASFSVSE